MIIKRYVANTTQEAMAQVKMDLGSDAVILNTRKIRKKGISGWVSKPLMEITAAIDHEAKRSNYKEERQVQERIDAIDNSNTFTHIEKKVDAMGEMVEKLVRQISQTPVNSLDMPQDNDPQNYHVLLDNEVHQEYALSIIERAKELQGKSGMEASQSFEHVILDCLGNEAKPIELLPGKRKVILFVGPTGVGKTTTLAKLAANFAIEKGNEVGFITADTYRIAAVDQLKIYAEILEIPMSIIYSPSEISKALKEHEDKDLVFIDTAGRSIRDQEHEKEISQLIALGNIDEVYLVISSNTSPQGCINIINSYKFLPNYKLIFTKLDEVTTYGAIINCCLLSQKPLSYITTGQNVPADIEVANINKIKDLLIGNVGV